MISSETFILPVLSKHTEGLEAEEIQRMIDSIMGEKTPWGRNSTIFKGELFSLENEGKIIEENAVYKITAKGERSCGKNVYSAFFSKYSCH